MGEGERPSHELELELATLRTQLDESRAATDKFRRAAVHWKKELEKQTSQEGVPPARLQSAREDAPMSPRPSPSSSAAEERRLLEEASEALGAKGTGKGKGGSGGRGGGRGGRT